MNLATRLIEEVGKRHKRIVVIGDALIDQWVHGHVEGCQDSCPKFVEESRTMTPGGAHNAEHCLNCWGVDTSLHTYDHRPLKWRFVDKDGRIVFRWDDEFRVTPITTLWKHRDLALEMVECAGAVLLSDYDKGFLTPEFIRKVVAVCHRRGVPCVADPKRGQEVYTGAILKANTDWCRWQATDWFKTVAVVTMGASRPCVYGENVGSLDLPEVKCINHVGAGDCFAVHLALALSYGFTLQEAATIAHSAGRVYVQHPHNRPPLPSEIEADMGPS